MNYQTGHSGRMKPAFPLLDSGYMPSDTTAPLTDLTVKASPSGDVDSPRGRVAAYGVLGLFAILLALVKSKHEMYLDEGQAWLIARDSNGFLDMVSHLHYEGHPALWYSLLYLPAHIFPHSMIFMQYLHYAISLATAWLILSERKLPMVLRVLLVFGITLFFSMGVLARSYMLASLLLIGAARYLNCECPRHWLGIALLGLAINTHFFAIPVAASIMILRRRCPADAIEGVALMPCGVTSNTHARTSATGKPINSNAITTRMAEFEMSKTGRT